MANYCDYEIHAKGTKKAALMLFTMMPCCDDKQIIHEEGTDEEYVVWIEGNCKWGLDSYCKEQPDVSIDLSKYSEDDIRDEECGLDYWYLTMRQKSELLDLDILAHSWSEESGFDQMEHYKKGSLVGCDYMPTSPDWEEYKDEFESYQDFCEAFNVDPNQNPPLWDRNEYPEYECFCNAFGIDPEKLKEEEWGEEDDDNVFYCMSASTFSGGEFEFEF